MEKKMILAQLGESVSLRETERAIHHVSHEARHQVATRHHRIMTELKEHHEVDEGFERVRAQSKAFLEERRGNESFGEGEEGIIIIGEDDEEEEGEDGRGREEEGGLDNPKGFFAARGLVRLRTRNTKLKDTIVKLGKDIQKTRGHLRKVKLEAKRQEEQLRGEVEEMKKKLETQEEGWIKARDELMKEFNNLNATLGKKDEELKAATKVRDLYMKEAEGSSNEIQELEDKLEAAEIEAKEREKEHKERLNSVEAELIEVKLKFAEKMTETGMTHV